MAAYGGVDFIDFDSQLNDEEKFVRQTARNSSKMKLFPSSKSTAAKALSRYISCRSWASWDFLARTCKAMAARECPTSLTVW